MNAGDTFFYRHDGRTEHLWVIVSDPSAAEILTVNFTTLRGGAIYHDPACVVERAEHRYLVHRSWMMYAGCLMLPGAGLRAVFTRNLLPRHDPCSPSLLTRIRRGAMESKHTPVKARKLLIEQGLVDDDL